MTDGNACWDDFQGFKLLVRERVEAFLVRTLTDAEKLDEGVPHAPWQVRDVALYAVRGGHRWRAMAVVAAGRIFREEALEICLPVGASIELAHAASMVLDDLPSMDDGALRRGQPCAHLQFADALWAVDLAPVYMVTLAYQIALRNENVGYRGRIESALRMSQTSSKMIAGQEIDVTQANIDLENDDALLACYLAKSGALYGAAVEIGATSCDAPSDHRRRLHDVGISLGLAYQFMDDVCDVTATHKQSGKNSGADLNKLTAVDFFGVDGAKTRAKEYQDRSLDQLSDYGAEAEMLRELVRNASWAPN